MSFSDSHCPRAGSSFLVKYYASFVFTVTPTLSTVVLEPTGFVSGGYASPRGLLFVSRGGKRDGGVKNSPLFEIAFVLVRFNHVVGFHRSHEPPHDGMTLLQ